MLVKAGRPADKAHGVARHLGGTFPNLPYFASLQCETSAKGENLCRAHATRFFCSEYNHNFLIFTPSQNSS